MKRDEPLAQAEPHEILMARMRSRAAELAAPAELAKVRGAPIRKAGNGSASARARRWFDEHPDQRVTLDELAALLGVSRTYCRDVVKMLMTVDLICSAHVYFKAPEAAA